MVGQTLDVEAVEDDPSLRRCLDDGPDVRAEHVDGDRLELSAALGRTPARSATMRAFNSSVSTPAHRRPRVPRRAGRSRIQARPLRPSSRPSRCPVPTSRNRRRPLGGPSTSASVRIRTSDFRFRRPNVERPLRSPLRSPKSASTFSAWLANEGPLDRWLAGVADAPALVTEEVARG